MIRDIVHKDIQKSVEIGLQNEYEMAGIYLDYLRRRDRKEYEAGKLGTFDNFDYLVHLGPTFKLFFEVKARSQYWKETAVPTRKETDARQRLENTGLKSYYVAYYLDIGKMYEYDMNVDPCRRGLMTRKDRDITDQYSYYNNGRLIYEDKRQAV